MTTTETETGITIDIDEDHSFETGSESYYRLVLDPSERRVYVEKGRNAHGLVLRLGYGRQYHHDAVPSGVDAEDLIDEIKTQTDALERICSLHSIQWSESAGDNVGKLDTDRFGKGYVRALLGAIVRSAAPVKRSHSRNRVQDFRPALKQFKDRRTDGLQEQYLQ